MIELKTLAAEIHEAALAKGFWAVEDAEEKHVAKMLSELGEIIQADRAGIMYEVERDGGKPEGVVAELADYVMMILDLYAYYECDFDAIGSVCEDYDGLKKLMEDTPAYMLTLVYANDLIEYSNGEYDGAFARDIFIAQAWAESRGFDLWQIIRAKMAYNESRPALHGRAY